MTAGSDRHVLISVYDKSGLADFSRSLAKLGFTLLSTGGTATLLKEAGIPVTGVEDFTGSPEILSGRVKTLHPKIHGGILFDRQNPEHVKECKAQGIKAIDLVVVNLYPFAKEARDKNLPLEKAIEYIDVGGPTMLRAAAKNFANCAAIIDPEDYPDVIRELETSGAITLDLRRKLAAKVFAATAAYDRMIADYFSAVAHENNSTQPKSLNLNLALLKPLRYGENPHQQAGFYAASPAQGLAACDVLHGKELSYNNLIDVDAAWALMSDFRDVTAAAIIKHTNPCGTAASTSESLAKVFQRALDADPKSAFGGIVAVNRTLDKATAAIIAQHFFECIAAPDFDQDALTILKEKKNLRLIKTNVSRGEQMQLRTIAGGVLMQTEDRSSLDKARWKVAGTKKPTEAELAELEFAFTVAKHVKSNAIVFSKYLTTVGVGAGQMSRIDAVNFAAIKAKECGKELKGSVMASDAFFPFRDCVDLAAGLGVVAIVQPGGSMRDEESIQAANEHGISLVFTGERHFRH
jgi:phosphoribosylaminoimidazolecarboxamide formyltransferase/IMP cyclohydrolase